MLREHARRGPLAVALAGTIAAAGGGLAAAAATPAEDDPAVRTAQRPASVAKNVIFIQGDGMGIAHRELIRLATKGKDGRLTMDGLRYSGWTSTDSADPEEAVTDSAAGATAFASGVRTFNGGVGVDAQGRRVPTLLERAGEAGKSTGLVTTAQVTDATPAAFGAHVRDRAEQSEIARQYLERSKPAVILGGGEDRWLPAGDPGAFPDAPATDPEEKSQSDKGNLIDRARELGYRYVNSAEALAQARGNRLLGLFANEEMFEQKEEGKGDVYAPVVPLHTMTAKALDVLSRDHDGFFLLVEEEGIDEFGHNNNAEKVILAGRALDRAVAVAMRYARRTPGTLVLVVGDHETGGLAIENVDANDESGQPTPTDPEGPTSTEDGPFALRGTNLQFTVDWTTGQHTGAATPLTAEGPGAATLARAQKNTDVHDRVLRAMRLDAD
jgi:alkaline phosphatase